MNIQTLSESLRIAPAVGAANLTMYPLLGDSEKAAGYLTLDEALAAGFVKVTEVSEAGHVPELTIVNDGPTPVLLLDGEELVGAKQNRIVNLTILVPARSTLRLPVSCVEAGRWSRRSHAFAAAGRTHYASGRAMKVEQVSCSLRESGARHADQGAIWADIDAKAARLAANSPTHAADAMYRRARASLDDFQARLEPLPCQVGAIFAVNGLLAGMELFDSPATWRKSMRKIVESYGLDAVDRQEEAPRRTRLDAAGLLESLEKAHVESFPSVGVGTDLRLKSDGLTGAALAVEDSLVHLLAFAQ